MPRPAFESDDRTNLKMEVALNSNIVNITYFADGLVLWCRREWRPGILCQVGAIKGKFEAVFGNPLNGRAVGEGSLVTVEGQRHLVLGAHKGLTHHG